MKPKLYITTVTTSKSSSSGVRSYPFLTTDQYKYTCVHRLVKTAARQQKSWQINTNEFLGVEIQDRFHCCLVFINNTFSLELTNEQQPEMLDGKTHTVYSNVCFYSDIVIL